MKPEGLASRICEACREGDRPEFTEPNEYSPGGWFHNYPGVGPEHPCPEGPSSEPCEAAWVYERKRCAAIDPHTVECPICGAGVQEGCQDGCPRWPRFAAAIRSGEDH